MGKHYHSKNKPWDRRRNRVCVCVCVVGGGGGGGVKPTLPLFFAKIYIAITQIHSFLSFCFSKISDKSSPPTP